MYIYANYTNERMIWVVNAYKAFYDGRILLGEQHKNNIYSLIWKHKKRWVRDICKGTNNNVFLDVAPKEDLIKIWIYKDELLCSRITKDRFYEMYIADARTSKRDFLKRVSNINIHRNF